MGDPLASVDLYWIPLGAGAQVVRASGKLFEALSALVQRRARCDLYHSALHVRVPEGDFVIEQAPIPDLHGERRGVVAEGPVGARWAGRFRVFRYEIRCWHDGGIPDAAEAIASPVRVSDDLALARRILEVLRSIPTPVWGRDEMGTGEMWNSNSVVSWALARSGADLVTVHPPPGGRAPGWHAGLVVADRDDRDEQRRPMRLALLGKPGSGKGTQGVALARHLGVPLISMGDLLRSRAADTTPRSRELRAILDRGELVPDDLVLSVVRDAVDAAPGGGYVLDGFPRTVAQAQADVAPVDAVVELALPDDVARERLARRASVGRTDDADLDAIERRLRRFHSDAEPLIALYRDRGILVTVDAGSSPDAVTTAILEALGR
jgi:adenylate kinase family enzyme